LDGDGDYVKVFDNPSLRPQRFTIEVWFKANTSDTKGTVVFDKPIGPTI